MSRYIKKSTEIRLMWKMCVLLLVFAPRFAIAQRGVVHYTRENGLISNEINDVAYDNDGFLWVATSSGVDRFDGQRFIHFQANPYDSTSIASNRVKRILSDNKGFVWCATQNSGLFRIHTKTFKVENFSIKLTRYFSSNKVNAFALSNQNQFILNPQDNGLSFFIPNQSAESFKPSSQFKHVSPRLIDNATALYADQFDSNIIWFGSFDGLFAFYVKEKKWKRFKCTNENQQVPFRLNGFENKITAIQQDGKGNFYIGSSAGGLLYFDKYQGVYRKFDLEVFPFEKGVVTALKWRDTRYLYVCFEDGDFQLFDTKRKCFIQYQDLEKVIDNPVHIARFQNQIAIATISNGLFIQNEALIFGVRKKATTSYVGFIDNLKTKTTYRISKFPTSTIEIYNKQANLIATLSLKEKYIDGFVSSDGENFLVTEAAVYLLKGNHIIEKYRLKNKSKRENDLQFIAAHYEEKGIVWLGTSQGGIFRFGIHLNELKQVVRNKGIPIMLEKGVIPKMFFAQKGKVLFYAYENTIGSVELQTLRYQKPIFISKLPDDQIRALLVDKLGRLWIGTLDNGCLLVDVNKNVFLRKIDFKSGLQSQQVDQLLLGADGKIWLLNPVSISVFEPKTLSVQSLERRNGMGNIRAMFFCGKNYYFTEELGYIVAHVSTELQKHELPKPYIMRVRELNDKPFVNNKLRFNYNENNLSFEFGVLDFSNSTNNVVSYRLKGLEKKWRNGNGKDEATYFNLPGKKYEFQIRIVEDGEMQIASYPFVIVPPFWQSWWFFLLLGFTLLVFIWLYLRIRVNRIKKTEKMRTNFNHKISEMEAKALRAQMNPHFLFNSLNSIRLFILKNEIESASDYIAKFSKLLRLILNHSRQDMITVYDEIQSLKLYLEFERLRFDHEFNFDLIIDGQEVLDCKIPPMIIQPFVENAIWHGLMPLTERKGDIKVSFVKKEHALSITVMDNGIGRNEAKENNSKRSLKEGSVGLQITKERLHSLTLRTNRLNDFYITDLFDENQQSIGTLVTLYFETE